MGRGNHNPLIKQSQARRLADSKTPLSTRTHNLRDQLKAPPLSLTETIPGRITNFKHLGNSAALSSYPHGLLGGTLATFRTIPIAATMLILVDTSRAPRVIQTRRGLVLTLFSIRAWYSNTVR